MEKTALPLASQNDSGELLRLLGPLVPALLRDANGGLDLTKIPRKNFDEFREFLITQVKIDGITFNEHVLASYHKVLTKEEYRPLLECLFAYTAICDDQLLKKFTAEIISVSAQKYVANNIQNSSGRQRIRSILSDKATFTKDLRADVAKAVAQTGYEMGTSTSTFLEFNNHLSIANYANITVHEEEDLKPATNVAEQILNQVEQFEKQGERFQNRYLFDPAMVERSPGLGGKITDEEIKEKFKLGTQGEKALDPVTQLKGKLARLWLLIVDKEKWKESNPYTISKNFAFLFAETKRLLEQGDTVHNEEDFIKWSESVRHFLQGGLQVTGEGWRRGAADFFSVGTVAAMMAPIPQAHRAPFDDLRQFVEEIHHSVDMGEKLYFPVGRGFSSDTRPEAGSETAGLKPLATGADPLGEVRATFINGLHQAKRSLWYGYKQHRALSRGLSYAASFGGFGDIKEIQSGQGALNQLIKKVETAKDAGEIQAAVQGLQDQLKEGGQLHAAMGAAEMEGMEQLLGLLQTIGILLISHRALQWSLGKLATAAAPAQVATYDTLGLRAAKAFGIGAYLAGTENFVAAASGEVRPDGEHILNWVKDSLSTGIAMMPTAVLGSFLGKQHPIAPSVEGRVIARYFGSGFAGAGHVAADTVLEIAEEWADASLRAKLDDWNALVGKDQAREIAVVSSVGGGFGFIQNGIVSEMIKGLQRPPRAPDADQTPLVPRARLEELKDQSTSGTPAPPKTTAIPGPEQTPLAPSVQTTGVGVQVEESPQEIEATAEEIEATPEEEETPEAEEVEARPEGDRITHPEIVASPEPTVDAESEEEDPVSQRNTVLIPSAPQPFGVIQTGPHSQVEVFAIPASEPYSPIEPTEPEVESGPNAVVEESTAPAAPEPTSTPYTVAEEPAVEATPKVEPESTPSETHDPIHEAWSVERIAELERQLAEKEGETAAAKWLTQEAQQDAARQSLRATELQGILDTSSREKDSKIAELKATNSTLTAERDTQAELRQGEEAKVARSDATVSELAARESVILGDLQSLQNRFSLSQQVNAGLKNELERRDAQVEQLEKGQAQLKTIHEEDVAKKNLDAARITELETTIKILERELKRRADLGEANAGLEKAVKIYRAKLEVMKDEKIHSRNRINELEFQVAGLQKELRVVRGELERASSALIREKARVDHLQDSVQSLSTIIHQAREQANTKNERIKKLTAEIKVLRESEEISAFVEDEKTIQLKEELEVLRKEKTQLLRQASKDEAKLAYKIRQLDFALDRQGHLIKMTERFRSDFLVKSEQFYELKGKSSKQEMELRSLRMVDDRLGVARDQLLGKEIENQDLRNLIRSNQSKFNIRIKRLIEYLQKHRARILELEKKVYESNRSLTKAEHQLVSRQQELKTLVKRLMEFRASHVDAKEIQSFIRHERYLISQIQTLNLLVFRAQDATQTARETASQFRRDHHTLTAKAEYMEAKLTELKETVRPLQLQNARQNREITQLQRDAQGKQAAQADAVRQRDLLKGKTRQLEYAKKLEGDLRRLVEGKTLELNQGKKIEESQQRQIEGLQRALIKQGLSFEDQIKVLDEQVAALMDQMEALTQERDGAQAEVARVREVEAELAKRVEDLSKELERNLTTAQQPASSPPPKRDSDAPPATVRIPDHLLAENIPNPRRSATPPYNLTPAEQTNNLMVTLADLQRARAELEQVRADLVKAEDKLVEKEHELATTVPYLRTILGSRGPAFFYQTDPRLAKVDPAIHSRLTLTDKQGEVIGRAEIIAGGKEGSILPVKNKEDGSIISAETSRGVLKKHQTGNQDSFYVANFTIVLDPKDKRIPVEVKLMSAVDGGENRGDLATVFLQGVHASAAEAAYQGRIPEAKELFEAGRRAVDAQHDFHEIPRTPRFDEIPRTPRFEMTGAGAVVVVVGNQAMIATGGNVAVVHTKKMDDGSYQSEGYSNFDVNPVKNFITNGVLLKTVVENKEGKGKLADGKWDYQYADPPRLYRINSIGPESIITIGSNGLWDQMAAVFTDGENFTGSKEWQNNKGQRGYLLQSDFRLFDHLLKTSVKKEELADQLHDMALANMNGPGQQISLKEGVDFLPARESPDNIVVIAYRHGDTTQNLYRISAEYHPLEKIYTDPPRPLLKYLEVSEDDQITPILQKYTAELVGLYGKEVGQVVAKSLANLYQNFHEIEEKFNPSLLFQAKNYQETDRLFESLNQFIANYSEVKADDNKPFKDAVMADLRTLKEAVHPFVESTRSEVQIVSQKYYESLSTVFGDLSNRAAKLFSDIYKNLPHLEAEMNPDSFKGLNHEAMRRKLIILKGKLSPDGVKPMQKDRFEKLQRNLNLFSEEYERANNPASFFIRIDPTATAGFDSDALHDQAPRSSYSPPGAATETGPSPRLYDRKFSYQPGARWEWGRINVPDPFLDYKHLQYLSNGRLWLVRDLGTRFGTWLDGKEISESKEDLRQARSEAGFQEIKHGSQLQAGGTFLEAELNEQLGTITLNIIDPKKYKFKPQGPALDPTFENNALKMNRAVILDILKGRKLGIHATTPSSEIFSLVVEQGALMSRDKKFGTINRQQERYWLENQSKEQILIERVQGEEKIELPLENKQQIELQWGDLIKIRKQTIQFNPG